MLHYCPVGTESVAPGHLVEQTALLDTCIFLDADHLYSAYSTGFRYVVFRYRKVGAPRLVTLTYRVNPTHIRGAEGRLIDRIG